MRMQSNSNPGFIPFASLCGLENSKHIAIWSRHIMQNNFHSTAKAPLRASLAHKERLVSYEPE